MACPEAVRIPLKTLSWKFAGQARPSVFVAWGSFSPGAASGISSGTAPGTFSMAYWRDCRGAWLRATNSFFGAPSHVVYRLIKCC